MPARYRAVTAATGDFRPNQPFANMQRRAGTRNPGIITGTSERMPSHMPSATDLNTWKQIAHYLGVSVREAQYREKHDGLPVRRLNGKKPRVWARQSDLDAWKIQAEQIVSPSQSTDVETKVTEQIEPEQARGLSRRSLLLGASAIVAAGSAVLSTRLLGRQPTIASARVEENSVCALDLGGRVVWRHRFPEFFRTDLEAKYAALARTTHRMEIVDFSRDGQREIVFAAAFPREGAPDDEELFCFSSSGKLLWNWRPEFEVKLGNERFQGPWLVSDMVFAPIGSAPTLYVSIHHWTWRPGLVVALRKDGAPQVSFVQSGHVYALHFVPDRSGGLVLAAGINNEYSAAALAVLKTGAPPSRSPQSRGSRYEVIDGPTGEPEKYFLFPPSELTLALGLPYNSATLFQQGERVLQLYNWEAGPPTCPVIQSIYGLNSSIEPESVTYNDSYASVHQQLWHEGKIHHSIDQCPELARPVPVRRWDPATGWTTLAVPINSGIAPRTYQRSAG